MVLGSVHDRPRSASREVRLTLQTPDKDLVGLPTTRVIIDETNVLRIEGEQYAKSTLVARRPAIGALRKALGTVP
jgi:hypothetical protein